MSRSCVVRETPKEIHRYPLKPEGLEEPLWMTNDWRRRVLEHLCDASWLCRASELTDAWAASTQSAHTKDEPVYVLEREGRVSVIRCVKPARPSWRRRPVTEVVEAWREVRAWWDEAAAVDRFVVRVMLSGGPVVDLARSRPDTQSTGDWSLVGVVD